VKSFSAVIFEGFVRVCKYSILPVFGFGAADNLQIETAALS